MRDVYYHCLNGFIRSSDETRYCPFEKSKEHVISYSKYWSDSTAQSVFHKTRRHSRIVETRNWTTSHSNWKHFAWVKGLRWVCIKSLRFSTLWLCTVEIVAIIRKTFCNYNQSRSSPWEAMLLIYLDIALQCKTCQIVISLCRKEITNWEEDPKVSSKYSWF